MKSKLSHQIWMFTRVLLARLRFVAVFLIAALIVGYWTDIQNHWDKWTRPAVAPDALASVATSDVEYYCVMHPNIVRNEPGNCPICGMPLVKRKKGERAQLPQDVLARVQLSPERIALAGIQTTTVEPRELVREIHALGVLDYAEPNVAQLSVRVAGRADELFIQYTGQIVNRGDRVYSLYSPELYTAQREYLLARKRVNELPADASAASRSDAAMVYNATMEKLVLWGITRDQLDEMDRAFDHEGKVPTHLVITSPISGVVVRKSLFEGGYVNVGDTPYTIADLSTLWLQVKLYEREVPLVNLGQPVQVTVDALPDRVFNGTVTFKSFQLDPQTRTLDARVEVSNPELRLRPGMFADASLSVPVVEGQPAPATQVAKSSGAAELSRSYFDALQPYLRIQTLLSQDKIEGLPELLHTLGDKLEPFASNSRFADGVKKIRAAAQAGATQNLETFRKASFRQLSDGMIELGKAIGVPSNAPSIQVFRCPMAKADWLQPAGTTANPFYGSEMLTCGGPVESLTRAADVKPTDGHAPAPGQKTLSIPRSSVIETGRREIVYVESSPGVYDMRAVKLGPEAGEWYPVLDGLKVGDKVVTHGAFLLDSENRLNPQQAVAPAPRQSAQAQWE